MPSCDSVCHGTAYDGLANIYQQHHLYDEAEQASFAAIAAWPSCDYCIHNLGNVYVLQYRYGDAIAMYKRALEVNPEFHISFANVAFFENFICQWDDRAYNLQHLRNVLAWQLANNERPVLQPYQVVDFPLTQREMLSVMRVHADAMAQRVASLRPAVAAMRTPHQLKRIIRVGFVSTGFSAHVRSHLSRSFFQLLQSSTKISTACYALSSDDMSNGRDVIQRSCGLFRDVSALSNLAIAQTIAADGVDVLIEFNGYWQYKASTTVPDAAPRIEISALQPAPLQMHMLAYPTSMAAEFIHMYIGDRIAVPPELAQSGFREHLIYMSSTYQVNSVRQIYSDLGCSFMRRLSTANATDVAIQRGTTGSLYSEAVFVAHPPFRDGREHPSPNRTVLTREYYGLQNSSFVMCDFNHLYKLSPEVLDTWARILHRAPHAVLWLARNPYEAEAKILNEARKRAIASRIVFSDRVEADEYIARAQLCDVFVDTVLYNSHATATDVLWAGLPVVALQGTVMQSRVAASLLHAVGLYEQLVVRNLQEYEARVLQFALRPDLLAAVRVKLCTERHHAPLFDTARWAAEFERVVTMSWDRHLQGLPPAHVVSKAQ
eukprot:TRINITY_DN9951_c0_g1_i1.p1 TRINITY_DN9951_c0_g1~~TRINITY_DN9951_c0_g1_i1.p1  ORF type:complete len:604 (-),score=149.06 TRINITY_DN9951_c0_g1_i1:40-1851(-)